MKAHHWKWKTACQRCKSMSYGGSNCSTCEIQLDVVTDHSRVAKAILVVAVTVHLSVIRGLK